jgi:photosystem II stability/assembly factor-like uncharacterized protein
MIRLLRTPRGPAAAALLTLGLLGLSLSDGRTAGQAPAPKQDRAKDQPKAVALPADWVKPMTWRSIGPANMAGRVTALAVYEADPTTYWVATASGGLLKTTNNGVTFEHQFDKEGTISIGDVCVAPSDKDVLWIGTGENNPRNSVSYGDGVYKSTDGGKSWTNMGLKETFQIGKVIIHPKDPNTVYVGALGRLYGPNPERGVFKTTDGGKTWQKVLFIDDRTGIIDMRMSPADPDTLIAAAWDRERDGFDSHPGPRPPEGYDGYDPLRKWGPGAGLYKTTDGGKTWNKLTQGLPSSHFGRVGLDWYLKDPKVVFAIIDCAKIGMGTPPLPVGAAVAGFRPADANDAKGALITDVTARGPAEEAGLKVGDVVRAFGDKDVRTARDLAEAIVARQPGDKVKVRYVRGDKEEEAELTLARRAGGAGAGGQRGGGRRGAGGGAGGGRGGAAGGGASLGLQAADAGDDQGARVEELASGGPAEKAGLKPDDVIKKIGGREVKSDEDLSAILRAARPGDTVKVEVARGNETREVDLTYAPRTGGGGGPSATRPYSAQYAGQRENVQDDQGPNSHEYGGVYKSTDAGETWTRINSLNPRPMYFSQVRVDPSDDQNLYVLGVSLYRSQDGGRTFRTGARGFHSDQHALWIDPRDGRHMVLGTDGGFYVTYDRMANWDHLNHAAALGQFYHVAVSTRKPYWVYGGLQDNGSWGGPSVGLSGAGPINEDWISVGGGDGFVCRVDPNDPDLVYAESQNGAITRYNTRTGERGSARPSRTPGGPQYRFNWNTPYILSHHNSHILYCAGNYVFRSVKQGADAKAISPEITRTNRGSATALAESPRNPDVLWVGTDDGALWLTRDGGKEWKRLDEKVGLAAPRWVATIEASRFAEGRAYVCFDAHRSNDDQPYLYMTDDFGQTWKNITADLPAFGSTRCLREDVENPNLLYCGTEFAAFASIDRGGHWTKINNNLPTVAVHEIAVHPTAGEIVAATHGRSLWILDVTALRQVTAETVADKPALYRPNTVTRWQQQPNRGRTNRRFVGQNPSRDALVYYSLPKAAEKVGLEVFDINGAVVSRLTGPTDAGLHRVAWDLASGPAGGGQRGGFGQRGGGGGQRGEAGQRGGGQRGGEQAQAAPQRGGGQRGGAGQRGGGGGGGPGLRRPVPPGVYRVVLTVDGQTFTQTLRVEGDPNSAARLVTGEEEDEGDDEDIDRDDD